MSQSDKKSLKPFPPLLSDEEAERFTDEADLSEYDFSGFKHMRFELRKKGYEKPMTVDQLAKVKDQDIDFIDMPELDEAFWKKARSER